MIIFDLERTFIGCEHGRDCEVCPNERIFAAMQMLKKAAEIFENTHNIYNDINVSRIFQSYGNTSVILERRNDNI